MRYKSKVKPTKGFICASIWTYVVVSVSAESESQDVWNVFESSKHKSIKEAREMADQQNDQNERYYRGAGETKAQARRRREYYVAEWKQVDGQCALVLMDEVH